ncbi:hypothetical protein BGZ82_011056 [Podila clonocystis]|nr:hypothetical protein BGZ82_011056 [Podila clonocystis]
MTHVILNLQYNLNAALILQILCSLPQQIQSSKLVAFTLLFLYDWSEWDDAADLDTVNSEELLAKNSRPLLTHFYLGVDCSSYEHDTLIPFFRTCPNIEELHLAPMSRPSEEDNDDEKPVAAALAKTILKHCPKITKMILAPQFNYSGLWSGVSLRLLEEFETIEQLHIDGEWGQPPPPITVTMVQKWSTSLTMLEYVSYSRVKTSDLLLVLTHCVKLLEIKTTKGWEPNGNDASWLWSLEWDRSPKVEDKATQRRTAKKVIEFHRQRKMLDILQVLELFWYFPYLEQMGMVPEDTWCHPMVSSDGAYE